MPISSIRPGLPPLVLTDDQFEDMARKGAFSRIGRVELRAGMLTPRAPIHVPQARIGGSLVVAFAVAVTQAGLPLGVLGHVSVRFGGGFQPIPDVVVFERACLPAGFDGPMPRNAVKLAIEVAGSTLPDDLGPKCRAYAAAGLPEYWVVDVRARQVIQHAEPAPVGEGADFGVRRSVPLDGPLRALTFDLTLPVGALDD